MKILGTLLSSFFLFNDPAPMQPAQEVMPEETIPGVVKYERHILVSKQNYPYMNNSPIDDNHTEMRATGLFKEEQITKTDTDVLIKLKSQYGIDMNDPNHVTILSNGVRIWPGKAVMFPFKLGTVEGQPWIVVSDSKHEDRNYQFSQQEFGTIVQLQSDFIVPKGYEKAGAHVTPGCIFFEGYIVHGKLNSDLTDEKNHEVFRNYSTQLTVQSLNMWTPSNPSDPAESTATLIHYPIIDSDGNEGVGISSTMPIKESAINDSGTLIEGRIVLSWIKDQKN